MIKADFNLLSREDSVNLNLCKGNFWQDIVHLQYVEFNTQTHVYNTDTSDEPFFLVQNVQQLIIMEQ